MKLAIRIFLSLFVIGLMGMGLLQLPAVQERLKDSLIAKVTDHQKGISLSIEKIEGFFPMRMKIENLVYKAPELDLAIDRASFTISIASLYKTSLIFDDVAIEKLSIKSEKKKKIWTSSPLPIAIHNCEVKTLEYNSHSICNLCLAGDFLGREKDFSVSMKGDYRGTTPLLLHADGRSEQKKIGLLTHIVHSNDADIWVEGQFDTQSCEFTGTIYGEGQLPYVDLPWKLDSPLVVRRNFEFYLPDLTLQVQKVEIPGEATYAPSTKRIHFRGDLFDKPLTIQGKLDTKEIDLNADYISSTLSLKTKEKEGDLILSVANFEELRTPLKEILKFDDRLEGKGKLHLRLEKGQFFFVGALDQFIWKEIRAREACVKGSWKNDKKGTFAATISEFDILIPSYEVFPIINLSSSGTFSEKELVVDGKISGIGDESFQLHAKLPLQFNPRPFSLTIDTTTPFSSSLVGKGSIDPLLSFLENASLIAKGCVDIDLAVQGYWDHPEIWGYGTFAGEIEDLTTGALFRSIEMEMEGAGEDLLLKHFSANDVDRGMLQGKGKIGWDFYEGFPFSIDLHLENFRLFAVDPFIANVNADLTIAGTTHDIALVGNATIIEGHIAIHNDLPVDIPTVDVVYINGCTQEIAEEEKPRFPISWNLTIDIPKNLIVEGRGLYSEWKGTMKILGEGENLAYSGELNLVGGSYDIAKHTFNLNDGKIVVKGVEPGEIFIDLYGNVDLASLIVVLHVNGTLDDRSVTLSSTPPMSYQQILSYMLFDTSINELTPMQACSLAQFLVSMSGKYSGPSTFDKFKQKIGIDVFDITSCNFSEMDFSFLVGKYISQGTFVGVNKSLSGNSDSLTIQTRVFNDFFLQADYGGSLNDLTPNAGKIIFKWYKSY